MNKRQRKKRMGILYRGLLAVIFEGIHSKHARRASALVSPASRRAADRLAAARKLAAVREAEAA